MIFTNGLYNAPSVKIICPKNYLLYKPAVKIASIFTDSSLHEQSENHRRCEIDDDKDIITAHFHHVFGISGDEFYVVVNT
jgi:hypothetical protein